jgi:hypothetical protein
MTEKKHRESFLVVVYGLTLNSRGRKSAQPLTFTLLNDFRES